jgi:Holliday junction resolvase-like predicted endonuclease
MALVFRYLKINRKHFLGRFGEWWAARYLERCGHIVWHQNWKSKRGEIDLITIAGNVLHVVEVKLRTGLDEQALLRSTITETQYSRVRSSGDAFKLSHRADIRRRGIKFFQLDLVVVTISRKTFFWPQVAWFKNFSID